MRCPAPCDRDHTEVAASAGTSTCRVPYLLGGLEMVRMAPLAYWIPVRHAQGIIGGLECL